MNINKYIAQSGLSSRRQADELIKAGKVLINGKVAKPIDKVSGVDKVEVEGKLIRPETKKVYLIFNKPVGIITTTDKESPDNIIDFIKYPTRIFPVGRLDVKSSGLIILTNDGEIVNKILKGEEKVEKEYLVDVDKAVNEHFLEKLEAGVFIEGFKTKPAKTKKLGDRKFSIIITEGKKRQVRRMAEKFGYNVTKLKRTRIGQIKLGDLKEGEYKELAKEEIYKLLDLK